MSKRPRESMPADVERALHDAGQAKAYAARPPYQRNDYLIWIGRAKRDETRGKRVAQMIAELKAGDTYRGMDWTGAEKG
ncbi:YdeI/OmpD-associated family protein [Pelagerythrobacter sp.]|uniref:YdeI/OmpD-associated family protein n=1 Tax=Pelagerythrobacter sp. TaxID=2800702 RepID=UPI0035B097BD